MGRAAVGLTLGCLVLLIGSHPTADAHAGVLDGTFGRGGKVMTGFTLRHDEGNAIAIQAHGRIVVAGRASGFGGRFAVARYNRDGTLDPTFSGNGKVMTDLTRGDDFAEGVAIQDDGKIVVAGGAHDSGRFAVVRYNRDGTLDRTFSGNGKVMTGFTRGYDFAEGVVIQDDGKIVAAGESGGPRSKIALARYNSDGMLDSTFDDDGKVRTYIGGESQWASAVAVQNDGKIVIAGTSVGLVGEFALVRYVADGSIDTTFGNEGTMFTTFNGDDEAEGLAIQANGKIVAAGSTAYLTVGEPGPPAFALARYEPDGSLDHAFGGDGRVITDFTPGSDGAAAIAIDPDGKLVAAGWADGDAAFAVARYKLNGNLDRNFGRDGTVMTNFTPDNDSASAVAIQLDGKIVVAGSSRGGSRFAVARYNSS